MKLSPGVLLVFITICSVWLAISFGSHLPDEAIHHKNGASTILGYKILAARVGFLFIAFLAFLGICGDCPDTDSKDEKLEASD